MSIVNAAQWCTDKSVIHYIATGVDVNETDMTGRTALMAASLRIRIKRVKILIDNGANIHQKDEDGDTALYYSASHNRYDTTQLLLSKGAYVNTVNKYGGTPLGVAFMQHFNDIVKILVTTLVIEIGLAMAPLDLPAYVVLWAIEHVAPAVKTHEKMAIEILQRIRDRYWLKI